MPEVNSHQKKKKPPVVNFLNSNYKIPWFFPDFHIFIKFPDFSTQGIFFHHFPCFPCFPESVATLCIVFPEIIDKILAQTIIISNLFSFTTYLWYSNHIYQEWQLLLTYDNVTEFCKSCLSCSSRRHFHAMSTMTAESKRKLVFKAYTEGQPDCQLLSQSLNISLSTVYRVVKEIKAGKGVEHKQGVGRQNLRCLYHRRLGHLVSRGKRLVDKVRQDMFSSVWVVLQYVMRLLELKNIAWICWRFPEFHLPFSMITNAISVCSGVGIIKSMAGAMLFSLMRVRSGYILTA